MSGKRTRSWVVVSILVAALAGAAGIWHWQRWPEDLRAGLPALPTTLGTKPAILATRIASAQAQTQSRASLLEGIANLGRLYHANAYWPEAEKCWRLLQAEHPREARWSYYLADIYRTTGDHPALVASLEQTVRLAPDYPAAWLQLAELEYKTGVAEAAKQHYQRRLALLSNDPYARLGLARIALQAGQREEARRLIQEIVRDTPEFPTAHYFYAELLVSDGATADAARERRLGRAGGRHREAEDPWLAELHVWCYDPLRLCVLGAIAYETRQSDRGRALFERAVELAPDNPGIYQQLGELYLKLGEAGGARDAFLRCIRRPNIVPPAMIFVNLAEAYRLLRQPAEAVQAVDDGLARWPAAFELHNERGAVLNDLGHHAEAAAAYRRALALAPDDPDSNFRFGTTLLALGQRAEAEIHLKRALVSKPTFPPALLSLGRLALEANQLDSAGKYLLPLAQALPDSLQVQQLVAEWHRRQGDAMAQQDASAAEHHYREGLSLDPDNADLNASLGVLYLIQGKVAEALVPLEALHRLRATDPQSCLFLGQAYVRLGRIEDARQILIVGRQLAERAGNASTAAHCQEMLDRL